MKTFENYNKDEKEMEELFLQLAHFDELYIYFDFITYSEYIYYRTNGDWLFDQNKIKKEFWISYEIFMVFEQQFYDSDIFIFIASMIEKYFGIKNYTIK